jgi:hypothetical protein
MRESSTYQNRVPALRSWWWRRPEQSDYQTLGLPEVAAVAAGQKYSSRNLDEKAVEDIAKSNNQERLARRTKGARLTKGRSCRLWSRLWVRPRRRDGIIAEHCVAEIVIVVLVDEQQKPDS